MPSLRPRASRSAWWTAWAPRSRSPHPATTSTGTASSTGRASASDGYREPAMRLSDLLSSTVFDAEGREVGRVRDVRLVQDGPIQGTFGAGLRVEGLIIGSTAVAS